MKKVQLSRNASSFSESNGLRLKSGDVHSLRMCPESSWMDSEKDDAFLSKGKILEWDKLSNEQKCVLRNLFLIHSPQKDSYFRLRLSGCRVLPHPLPPTPPAPKVKHTAEVCK